LNLRGSVFADVPRQIYGIEENAIDAVRAFYADLRAGETVDRETKLILLGNGSAGKTQLCRRLRREEFNDNIPSTHGIEVHETKIKLEELGDPVPLNIWDFGGQEIYHGTHALFVQGRAVFAILWTPELEEAAAHQKPGALFRDRPLIYWLDYVRFFADTKNPVILVQSQFDTWVGRVPKPPSGEVGDFDLLQTVRASAKTKNGPDAMRAALDDAVREGLLVTPGQRIGTRRVRVRNRLRELLKENDDCYRLLDRADFDRICNEEKGVSSTEALLEFLHNTGAIYYCKELFNGRIVLDQNWALQAVYTVFDREKTLPILRDENLGRFTRLQLHRLVWGSYTLEQQEVFLGLMESCGICFRAGRDLNGEVEYVAPELLPSQTGAQRKLINGRVPLDDPAAEAVASYPFLHEGILRNFLSRIGSHAGDAPQYWRYGCWFYEEITRSTVLIEGNWADAASETGPGTIRFRTWGDRARDLIQPLVTELKALKLGQEPAIEWRGTPQPKIRKQTMDTPINIEDFAFHKPSMPCPEGSKVFVSHAGREDASEAALLHVSAVDHLCQAVRNEGLTVFRAATGKPYGETLAAFLRKLGPTDLVIVVFSELYLQSVPCMTELYLLWQRFAHDKEEFKRRVVALFVPDAKIQSPGDRAAIGRRWEARFTSLQSDFEFLEPEQRIDHGHIKKWRGEIGEILVDVKLNLHAYSFAEATKTPPRLLKDILQKKCEELRTPSPQVASDQELLEAIQEMAAPSFRMWAMSGEAVAERKFGSTVGSVSDRAELAIVFTDIVESTALGQKLGDEAMEALRRSHFAKSKEFIRQFQGREVKTIGDSFMVAFHSADSALAYARELQQDPGDPRLQVRAGIHVGKMTVDGEDVFGGAVNFAARVVSAAKGPEIWVSDAAKKKLGQPYKGMNWQPNEGLTLKGFEPEKFTLWSLPPGS